MRPKKLIHELHETHKQHEASCSSTSEAKPVFGEMKIGYSCSRKMPVLPSTHTKFHAVARLRKIQG